MIPILPKDFDYARHTWLWTAELTTAQHEADEIELGERVSSEFDWQDVLDRARTMCGRGPWAG